VRFRFGHLFEDSPELVFTGIEKVSGTLRAVRRIWGHERSFGKGDVVDGIRIVDVRRDRVTCELRQKTWQVSPTPPPPRVVCTGTERKGEEWIAKILLNGAEEEYRKGDDIQGAQIVDITADGVECQYHGVRQAFGRQRPLPDIRCRATRKTATGWVVHVQHGTGLKELKLGDTHMDARVTDVRSDGVTFEFGGQAFRVQTPAIPELTYTGYSQMGSTSVAFVAHEGRQYSAPQGDELVLGGVLLHVEEVTPTRLRLRYRGVTVDVERK
jgi:hypothetical protein